MFGYGRYKRSRDTTMCGECEEEEIDMDQDEWDVCGDCERTMCSYCMQQKCSFCGNTGGGEMLAHSSSICEMCMTSCEDCDDAIFHKNCLVQHLKTCNQKTRAQRALASVKKEREQTEANLEYAKKELAAIQSRIEGYGKDLVRLKENEAKAELELKAEVEADAKKK